MTLPYDLVRGLHILSVIAWMAGMLMLPRFFIYQYGAVPGGDLDRKMTEAAGRLAKIILTPALIAAWVFGGYLLVVYDSGMLKEPWLIGKLALVIGMSGLHGFFVATARKFARGERPYSEKFWRLINEAPFVMAIAIVLLATLEPRFG
ncbi:MAG: CopD family protein [Alphaproteobacteria bacterium]|nr:CopD family protein [Alphaproteobacteria bacterium]